MIKNQKVIISGSSGLTGGEFLKILLNNVDRCIFNLILPTNKSHPDIKSHNECITFVQDCNLNSSFAWNQLLCSHQPDAIIVISNIRHVPPLLEAVNTCKNSVTPPRLIVIGTTGVFSSFLSYSKDYRKIEQELSLYPASTILLRPSMIYGSKNDKNMHKLVRFIKKYKFFVIFGNGNSLMQPVYYKDLAMAIYTSLVNPQITGSFNISGKYIITYREIVKSIFLIMGLKPRILFISHGLAKLFARILDLLPYVTPPFTTEQIDRLREDKIFDYHNSRLILGYDPIGFHQGIRHQILTRDF